MKRIFTLAVAVAAFAVAASAPAAGPPTTGIVDGSGTAVASGTCTCDATPGVLYREYTVSFSFTHRGPVGAQIYEMAAPTTDNPPQSAIMMVNESFVGSGSDIYTATVCGGLLGQTVYFKALLVKGGPHRTMQVLDSLDFGPYNG